MFLSNYGEMCVFFRFSDTISNSDCVENPVKIFICIRNTFTIEKIDSGKEKKYCFNIDNMFGM